LLTGRVMVRVSGSAGVMQRRAVRLELFTIAWNAVEFVVTVGLGLVAGSLALVAFGLDSLIEIFASVVVIWQLGGRAESRTRRAMALVALAFLALSVFLLAGAARSLLQSTEPDSSPFGIAYMAIAATAMFVLAWRKRHLGDAVQSHPLVTEARMTLLDGVLASGVLVALIANTAFGAWWADPLAAAAVALAALRESIDAWRDSRDPSRMTTAS
jgi:divalent metal cation (Fe/Co/Zn/Cd) transporter